MKRSFVIVLLVLFLSLLSTPVFSATEAPVSAAAIFDPNLILRDEDVFSTHGWNAEAVQRFLESRKSGLAITRLPDRDGTTKRVADIIWRIAEENTVSPRYLLALLQKEQSLVDHPSPSNQALDWATGYGVCDSCSPNDPALLPYKGFATQVERAAKLLVERYALQLAQSGQTISGYAVGKPTLIDGRVVVPENRATAMLYTYTPHIHGNYLLWMIWRKWFGTQFPDGTIVRTEQGSLYLIRGLEKRRLESLGIAASLYDLSKTINVRDTDLFGYKEGSAIRFPNFSLVEVNGERYLLSGDKKRHIVSDAAFRALGFNEDELIFATDEDVHAYEDGPDVTEHSRYPTGLLARDTNGGYWYIESETRRPLSDAALVKLYFSGRPAKKLTPRELQSYPIGPAFLLRDGELVKSPTNPTVYVIVKGEKRRIPSAEIFTRIGWNWKNVVTLPNRVLKAYPDGQDVTPEWQDDAPPLEVTAPSSTPSLLTQL